MKHYLRYFLNLNLTTSRGYRGAAENYVRVNMEGTT